MANSFAEQHGEYLVKNYNEGKGTHWIAKQLNVNANTVLRALKALGVQPRTKSEAQKINLEQNGHPLSGTVKSEEDKIKISEGTALAWSKKTDEEMLEFKKKCSDRANAQDPQAKQDNLKKAFKAIKLTTKNGSKLENFIFDGIIAAGYSAVKHRKVLQNEKLEVDILLSDRMIAIEVDGPSHQYPIRGEDVLAKVKKADADKNGLLVLNGYKVIRVQSGVGSLTQKYQRDSLSELLNVLSSIDAGTENRSIIFIKVK